MLKKETRILVADDEKVMANIIGEELRQEGYEVDVVYSGTDTAARIARKNYDLLILDNRMPGENGIDILKETNQNQKIILMTAFATVNDAVDAMKLGAVDYIQKPFDSDKLIKIVKDTLSNCEDNEEPAKRTVETKPKQTLVGHSPAFMKLYNQMMQVKDLNTTILLIGESGTGKSVLAKEMHNLSKHSSEPFVYINCATIPPNLVESELFGHVKGAFTGACGDKRGKFEQAGRGTLFMDEISTLPYELQTKLLTVLQERKFEKVGGEKTIEFKGRIISATNANLMEEVKKGTFRKDLFYRLNVITLECPPLRERPEDIEDLFWMFLEKFKNMHERSIQAVDDELIEAMKRYPWYGNIRELENTVERIVAMNTSGRLTVADWQNDPFFESYSSVESKPDTSEKEESEYDRIIEALRINNNHREKTAAYLGISRRTLQYKLKKYNIK